MNAVTPVADAVVLPGDDRDLRRLGYGILLVVFGGFGGWAALAPLDSAAVAPGVITVQNYRRTVQHLEGGIVQALRVREGQQVRAGDVLVDLEGTQFRAELDMLRAQQATLGAQEARLLAERDRRPAVQYPADDPLPATDPRVIEARQGQDTLFRARRRAYEGEVSVLRQSITQLRAQIAGLESVQASKRGLIASYRGEMKDLQELLAEGFADRQKLREFERNVAALEGEVAELAASIAAAQAKINEAELRMLQVDREFQTGVAAELGETQAKLSDVTERLRAAQDRVTRAQIRAPVSGRVLQLRVHTVGGVVTPGQPLMDVVPEREALVVEAQVQPVDIDRVHAGLDATIRFSSFKRTRVPDVKGRVTSVSADRLLDEKTGLAYFLARVEISADERERLRGVELKPGMPAETMINTGSRTLLGYLWEPLGDAVARSFRED
jgi:epimerase transport system membrane fusion protein